MKRIEIQLDDDLATLFTHLAGGKRKQSEYIAVLLRREAQNQTMEARLTALAAQVEALQAELAQTQDSRHER